MQYHTLENLSIESLCQLFNRAFSDYILKIELSPDFFKKKLISEDIDLSISAGAFKNGKPVGFILHALRDGVAYNGGTGVIPEARGNHLTCKMYEYLLPKLKQKGTREISLEVIDKNLRAIKSYQKVGFEKLVDLNCYKGIPSGKPINLDIQIKRLIRPDFPFLESFWEWQPTWQHASRTLQKSNDYTFLGAYKANQLVAYASVFPEKGRVAQFAVHPRHRKQGVASTLFQFIKQQTENELYVMNVDGNHKQTHRFLESMGLTIFITQHKMKLKL